MRHGYGEMTYDDETVFNGRVEVRLEGKTAHTAFLFVHARTHTLSFFLSLSALISSTRTAAEWRPMDWGLCFAAFGETDNDTGADSGCVRMDHRS